MKYKNSIHKGLVRFIVFREGDTWYGTCLEFNIVESGDTAREALVLLLEAVQGYLESARKVKARPPVLNQKADVEYEEIWSALEKRERTPAKEIFTFGNLNIGARARVPA